MPAGTPTYNANAKWVTDHGSQLYNVKAYGAYGDGTHDDTAAIQSVLNTVCGTPGTSTYGSGWAYFPFGNYKISSPLICWSNNGAAFHISGAAGGGQTAASGTTISWYGPSGGAMMIIFSGSGWTVENLNFDCREVATYGVVGTATNIISTTLGTAVGGPGSATVTPGSMSNIVAPTGQYPGTILNVDTGSNFEAVFVTATATSTFTATFTKAHAASAAVGGSGGLSNGVFRDVSVFNDGGAYSAGFLVGNPTGTYGADISNVQWYHSQVTWNSGTGAQSGNLYTGVLFAGGNETLDFHFHDFSVGYHQHAIDASLGYGVGKIEVQGFSGGANTVSDFLVNHTGAFSLKDSWTILGPQATLIDCCAGTYGVSSSNAIGPLDIENVVVQAPSGIRNPNATHSGDGTGDDMLIRWGGAWRIHGLSVLDLEGNVNTAITFQASNISSVEITNSLLGACSTWPVIYDGGGSNPMLPSYYNHQPMRVRMNDNWGFNGSAYTRLPDYDLAGIVTDESQSYTSISGVLNGGDTSCLLGFRNHANSADLTVCKNASDQLVLNGFLFAPADYPVFGASGTNHAQGAVPDPGSTAGSTRFLREDGGWNVPTGSGTVTSITPGTGLNAANPSPITTSGTLSVDCDPLNTSVLCMDDEFSSSNVSASMIGLYQWQASYTASYAGTMGESSGAYLPDINYGWVKTNAAQNSVAWLYARMLSSYWGNAAPWTSIFRFYVSEATAGNAGYRVGFPAAFGPTTNVPTAGFYIRYDPTLSDGYIMVCNNASSVETCASSGVSPLANDTPVDVTFNMISSGKLGVTVAGGSQVTICSSGCTITATPSNVDTSPAFGVMNETTSVQQIFALFFRTKAWGLSR